MIEIERKWLVAFGSSTNLGEPLPGVPREKMQQYYLSIGDPEVRIRSIGDRFLLGMKWGSGAVRNELEVPLAPEQFNAMTPFANWAVHKMRYHVPGGWEVDRYDGALLGLVVMEREGPLDEALPPFPRSIDVLQEVTGNPRFANKHLAQLSSEDAEALVHEVWQI